MFNPVWAQLRDVNQAFEVLITQFGERTKIGQVSNGTFDQLPFFEILNFDKPGILLKLADGQANALAFLIQADNFDLYLLPNFENIFGVLDAFPRNLGQVHKAIGSVDVHESTKVCQAGNTAFANSANR